MSQLDIFEHRFGDEAHPGVLRADEGNSLGDAGLRMLDAIQTVVDVLADEVNGSYRVSFADFDSAMTDQKRKRIIISGKPLTKAKAGTPYRDIAAILTGFAVHEVGHTKRVGIIKAIADKYPGKKLPHTLANVVEDVVLEARTIEQYAGFRDVFDDAFTWVAELTCPKYPISWGGSSGDKVNFVGQVVRYRPFVQFAGDHRTQEELRWFDDWRDAITASMTPDEAVAHIEAAMLRIAKKWDDERPGDEPPEGPTGPGGDEPPPNPPKGEGKGEGPGNPSIPDEEDDDPEGGDETEPGDDKGDTEGGDESGDEPGEGKGDGPDGDDGKGTGKAADTLDRKDGDKGSTDTDGSGGTGQTIAEASDPDDFDESKLDKSFDDIASTEPRNSEDYVLQKAVNEERTTARFDAGVHGKMRVIFR